ncbi:hypothetical protein ACYCCF_21735 [Streptomyces argenteolus]
MASLSTNLLAEAANSSEWCRLPDATAADVPSDMLGAEEIPGTTGLQR